MAKTWHNVAFGLAKGLGLAGQEAKDALAAMAFEITGKERLSECTAKDGDRIILELKRRLALKQNRPGRASRRQIWKIRELVKQLGWTDEQLLGFTQRQAKTERLEWASAEDASGMIEALKDMVGRKEVTTGARAAEDS